MRSFFHTVPGLQPCTHIDWFVLSTTLKPGSCYSPAGDINLWRISLCGALGTLKQNCTITQICPQSQRPKQKQKKLYKQRCPTNEIYTFFSCCPLHINSHLFCDSCPPPNSLTSRWSHKWQDTEPPSLTPALSNTSNIWKHVQFTTQGLSLPQMGQLFWGLGAARGSRLLMQSHSFLSWPSSALALPPSTPSDSCRCGAVLLQPTEGGETGTQANIVWKGHYIL